MDMLEIIDHGTIREIRLERPPANALNPELTGTLKDALAEAGRVADAVIVSGRPGMFSAGLDVPQLLGLERAAMTEFWRGFTELLNRIASMPVPTVFALTGHAPAGGIVMALFGDYRIMPRGGFKTGFNESQVGLVVPPQVHQALVRLIGAHTAERILVSGEIMEAERALEIGLVDELVDGPDDAVPHAIDWCEALLALPRSAMLLSRTMARRDLRKIFDNTENQDVGQFVDVWFDDSTQTILRKLVERLARK
jgi:enoyl-CoA hydratase/carnithine racemase